MATSENHGMGKLLSLAVHEFRTPVSVVAGYVRMLLREQAGPIDERQRKLLEATERSCTRLAELVSELAELGNFESGTSRLSRSAFSLAALLTEVVGNVQEGLDRGVRVEVRGSDRPLMTSGDPTRLRTAFSAILVAILREKADPTLIVAECSVRHEDRLALADVLFGEEKPLNTLSENYPRSWGTFDEWRGGVGLSLPIARRIIEAHGGQIRSPQEPGRIREAIGVSLPLTESPA